MSSCEIDLGDEGVISVSHLSHIDQFEAVAEELGIYLRKYSKRRGVANSVLRYLNYVAALDGGVGSQSLRDFKTYIDHNSKTSLNSKYQLFGNCKAFVKHFMAAGYILDEPLPKGFPVPQKTSKKSFSDLIRSDLQSYAEALSNEACRVRQNYDVNPQAALSLVYCRDSMKSIHTYSLEKIGEWERDWVHVERLVSTLSVSDKSSLAGVASFKSSEFSSDRTVEIALKILFSRYNRELPSSLEWPSGMADFLKRRGWTPRRVGSALFPTSRIIGYYLTAILSHPTLSPNVDSVAFGLYLSSVKPAFEKGYHSIYLRKNRGASKEALLSSSDPLVQALLSLQAKLRQALPDVTMGVKYLSQHNVPMMVHITPSAGRQLSLRQLDPSSTSHVVRRVVREAAKEHSLLEPIANSVSGENFRPTHALIARLLGRSNAQIKKDLGHKNLSTTVGYTDRVETHALLIGKYQGFQKFLIDEAGSQRRTGSGYLCSRTADDTCIELDKCFACADKRIVLSSPEIAAEWIAWRDAIKANESRFRMANPERWNVFWQVKLAEYESLIQQLDERAYLKAQKLSVSIVLPPLD